jgi:hypothetical protein
MGLKQVMQLKHRLSSSTQGPNGKSQKPTLRTKLDQRLQSVGG